MAGFVVAGAGLPPLTMVLAASPGVPLTDDILLFLAVVVAVALIGGRWPALLAAVGGFLLLNYYFTPPLHTLAIATGANLTALAVFVIVALAVSWVVDLAARRTRQADRAAADARTLAAVAGSVLRGGDPLAALLDQLLHTFRLGSASLQERDAGGWQNVATAGSGTGSGAGSATGFGAGFEVPIDDTLRLVLRGPALAPGDLRIAGAFAAQAAVALRQQRLAVIAEGDRVRTALLAAVSHDLRTPLAAAKAAVAGLRSDDVTFDDTDRAELLATADESLDRLIALVANLLDMSRLQAGALGLTAVPVGLEDVVPRALDELGAAADRVAVRIPDDLAAVRADSGLLDRVLVNLLANALRFSPPDRPPVITAAAAGDRVEVRVVDHGPGVPPGRRELIFEAFQRLGDRDNHTGVGLGLALSRGLTEAMGGTLVPAETDGGGLTMVLSLPALDQSGPDGVLDTAGSLP